MRIISGKYKAKKLADCKHLKDLRPTTDSNRENLFNILQFSKKINNWQKTDFKLSNYNFLDVFCGSGAVSFEALSRGVISATLVDFNKDHLTLAKENAKILNENNINFLCLDLSKKVIAAQKKYNLIFIDPPYSKNIAQVAINNLIEAGWIEKNALVIIEHCLNENLKDLNKELQPIEQRQYKQTTFSFFGF